MSSSGNDNSIQNGLDNVNALLDAEQREEALREIERVRRALEEEYNRSREAATAANNG
jgi:hypothetical protein